MTFREIILTKKLLFLKIYKMRRLYKELTIDARPRRSHIYMDLLKKCIDNNTIYCGVCDQPIDESHVNQTIIINKNQTSFIKKWYHKECSLSKNMID